MHPIVPNNTENTEKTIPVKWLRVISFLVLLVSCNKETGNNDAPPTPRPTYLLAISWGLVSSTSIDSLSSGMLHNYLGNPEDSLNVNYDLNPNLKMAQLTSYIDGANYASDIDTLLPCSGVKYSDTATIAFDTLVTATPWRPNYSDTLFISKLSPTTFVFRVRYADASGFGVETDSFNFLENR